MILELSYLKHYTGDRREVLEALAAQYNVRVEETTRLKVIGFQDEEHVKAFRSAFWQETNIHPIDESLIEPRLG